MVPFHSGNILHINYFEQSVQSTVPCVGMLQSAMNVHRDSTLMRNQNVNVSTITTKHFT